MWPFCVLLKKILRAEEEIGQESDGDHLTYRCRRLPVPLINQQRTWDCGLACVLMVLTLENSWHRIWSVDLAFLLQKFSVRFSYFTITVGANPKFFVETFYKVKHSPKLEQFLNELVRGEMLFQKAIEAIRIQSILVAIQATLVAAQDTLVGHYVVICGYNAVTDEFEIQDPASSRKHQKITSNRLDEAHKSFGTDL
ncbi:hypothetical protein RHGRI_007952 [Rhododendron griersonianum]|uniref:Guanylyl cyclase n=1 Tax=Rhododendron griersonianum TaxID=479676 RepID=A0AAV6KZP4_9ERIC|nr:hypothetical protein RHGRI_007952 [Rhododendron griersonianum]